MLRAPAKLTTSLRVTGTRPDGYHLLEAEMVSVSLYDDLELSDPGADGGRVEVVDEVDWIGQTPAPPVPATAGANLVEVALAAVDRQMSVSLTKRIPAGAGLGGGSADAAAILRWAGCDDLEVAAGIGADVPFCLRSGRAFVGGIGEVVEPLRYVEQSFLLLVPGLHVSTPAVYRAWDDLDGPHGEHGNDLEPAALAVEPELAWWRDLAEATTGLRPKLAGSGGTWWMTAGRPRLEELAELCVAAVSASGRPALVSVVDAVAMA